MGSMEFQVTGERSPWTPSGDRTSLEFEIATLATDQSGFSDEKALLLSSFPSQVASTRRM